MNSLYTAAGTYFSSILLNKYLLIMYYVLYLKYYHFIIINTILYLLFRQLS